MAPVFFYTRSVFKKGCSDKPADRYAGYAQQKPYAAEKGTHLAVKVEPFAGIIPDVQPEYLVCNHTHKEFYQCDHKAADEAFDDDIRGGQSDIDNVQHQKSKAARKGHCPVSKAPVGYFRQTVNNAAKGKDKKVFSQRINEI